MSGTRPHQQSYDGNMYSSNPYGDNQRPLPPPPPPPPHPAQRSPSMTYNPQHYAQTTAQYSPVAYASASPPVPPRPYNPAAYNTNTSPASPATNFFGQPATAYPPHMHSSSQYAAYSTPIQSPQTQEPSNYGSFISSPYNSRVTPDSPNARYFQGQDSAPLVSRPYPDANNPALQYDAGFHRAPLSPHQAPHMTPHYYPPQSPQVARQEHPLPIPPYSPSNSNHTGQFSQAHGAPVQNQYQASSYTPASDRHPRRRPLPGRPVEAAQENQRIGSAHTASSYGNNQENQYYNQDELFDQVESALLGAGSQPNLANNNVAASRRSWQSEGRVNGVNGRVSSTSSHGAQYDIYNDYGADSDAEAEAGLDAMRRAYEDDQVRSRRTTASSTAAAVMQYYEEPTSVGTEDGADGGYVGFDVSALDGSYAPGLSFGSDQTTAHPAAVHTSSASFSTAPMSSHDTFPARSSSHTSAHTNRNYETSVANARVDAWGTGGFEEPAIGVRKLSFDQDDEKAFEESSHLEDYAETGDIPDLGFFATPTYRPLPSVPDPATDDTSGAMSSNLTAVPTDLEDNFAFQEQRSSAQFPRSQSLAYSATSELTIPPIRSKTAAEERMRKTGSRVPTYSRESLQAPPATFSGIDVLSLPAKKFQPSKLSQRDFNRCEEPWALSSLTTWLQAVAEAEVELKENTIAEALVNLFTFKVPNLNIAEAETLSTLVIGEMINAGTLVQEEEWLRFGRRTISGVLFQLTGRGCYAAWLHESDQEVTGRCYAHHCQRTVKKLNLQGGEQTRGDWATFYNLKKEDLEGVDRKQIELQNNLHEIVQAEELYLNQLKVYRTLYRNALRDTNPPVISPKSLEDFEKDVFGNLEAVEQANANYLLPQLKYRQQEQGPWITGFSDIFRDWIRKAKAPYVEYAANSPKANHLFRTELQRNSLFRAFVESNQRNQLSQRLNWDHYMKAPITKLQRYSLLLSTVHKNMKQDSEEKHNLQTAIDEIKAVTSECNSRVEEMDHKMELFDLANRLKLRPEMKHVDLNLTQWGRTVLHKGELQRTGTSKFTWLDTYAFLLDNYLVLAKNVSTKDAGGGKVDSYDVSKMPIPMDLLILESADDDPVTKSRGIAPVTPVMKAGGAPGAPISRAPTNQAVRPGLTSNASTATTLSTVSTNTSDKSFVTNTVLDSPGVDEKIMYPFRVRHLGREVYTLYATTLQARTTWCEKIIEAKTKHAASLFAQNAEPFKVRIVADSAFAYDSTSGYAKSILIKGTPLSRSLEDVERMFKDKGRPAPICRARVNCATTFTLPSGTKMMAIGTDYGVYVAESGNTRAWTRAVTSLKVTQISVLEEFNLFLIITDKVLVAHHLDIVCPPPGSTNSSDSNKKSPQKLSGAKDVGFFAVGRMKDRVLVFYKKKEGLSSTFKILEPIYSKSTERKARLNLSSFRGQTDFFREFDDFYIPADCIALDLFSTTLAVSTSKGFEVLNLEKKTPFSVPDLKAPHVGTIAARLHNVEPLAMFRLPGDGGEFLCVYEECAVYVNKHGDIFRSVVMEFVGRARQASLVHGFLVLFDQDFVEVRDALNGRLKQVIAGRDVRCLDNARSGMGVGPTPSSAKTIKFALQHPEYERTQLVCELILNETRRP